MLGMFIAGIVGTIVAGGVFFMGMITGYLALEHTVRKEMRDDV